MKLNLALLAISMILFFKRSVLGTSFLKPECFGVGTKKFKMVNAYAM